MKRLKTKYLNLQSLIVLFLIAGAIILPSINLGFISLRLSDLISLILLPCVFSFCLLKLTISKSSKLFLLFIFSTCISLFNSYFFLNVPFSIRDINEILRYIILLFVLFYASSISYDKIVKICDLFFAKTYLFLFIFGFFQKFFYAYLPTNILKLWGGDIHVDTLLSSSLHRIFITGSDPNIGAVIAALYMFYFYSKFYNTKNRIYIIRLLLMLILIVFTSSRTILVGVFFVFLFHTFVYSKIKISKKIVIFLFCIVIFTIIFFNTPYLYLGVSSLLKGTNNSVLVRLSNFLESIELFKQSPIFGWGPAKVIHKTVADGEYFLILRRYGSFGVFSFLLFIIYSLKISKKYIDTEFGLIFFLYVRLGLFVMITNNLLSGYQLGVPFVVLLGGLESYKRYKLQRTK